MSIKKRVIYKKWPLVAAVLTLIGLLSVLFIWEPIIQSELLELPEDYSYTAETVSYDSFYDEDSKQYTGEERLDTTLVYAADIEETNGPVHIVNVSTSVMAGRDGDIASISRVYGIDHENREHVPGYGDRDRSGYLFGPVNAVDTSFTYWHVKYDAPFKMVYQDQEDLLGLKTYHYRSTTTVDRTNDLSIFLGENTEKGIESDIVLDIWIEPKTGELVQYNERSTSYYYNLESGDRLRPWKQSRSEFSFDSLVEHVILTEKHRGDRESIGRIIPALVGLVAVLALVFVVYRILSRSLIKETKIGLSVCVSVCLVTLFGWAIGSEALTMPFGGEANMHPVTATGGLIMVLAIIIASLRIRKLNITINILLMIFGVIMLVNIIDNITGSGWVITDSLAAVSPATSLSFLIISIVILLFRLTNRLLVVLNYLLLSTLFIVCGASVLFAGYDNSILSGNIWFKAMSIPTAIMFMSLVVATFGVIARPDLIKSKFISRPLVLSAITLFSAVFVTGVMWQSVQGTISRDTSRQFERDSVVLQSLLEQKLSSYVDALRGARSLFAASDNVSRSEWKDYIDGLELAKNFPGNQGIGYSMVVPYEDIGGVEELVRNEGYPDFSITPSEPKRDIYTTILYLEPFDARNQRAFGYDMFSELNRRTAMETARDNNEPAMSGRVTLLQETETDVQAGFLVYLPVYEKNKPHLSLIDRRENIVGYVYSPIRVNNFMEAAIGNQSSGIGIEIFDTDLIDGIKEEDRMYSSVSDDEIKDSVYSKSTILDELGHSWVMRYSALPGYTISAIESSPIYVLIGGLSASVLLSVVIFVLASSRQRALSLANSITKDLRLERNRAVKSRQKDEAILTSINEGLVLFNKDEKIERINVAAARMLGFSIDELKDKRHDEVLKSYDESGKETSHDKCYLCEVTKTGKPLSAKTYYKRKDGAILPVSLSVAPIISGGRITGIIEVFHDITAEEALDQAKTDFISLASHQLRTPLTANKWYLEMLLSGEAAGKLSSRKKDLVEKVNASNERLIDLVVSLLNVSRVDSGRLSVKPVLTDFVDLVESVAEIVQPQLKSKKQRINIAAPKRLLKIKIDANLMRQVVLNLLTNASKYSPDNTKIDVAIVKKSRAIECSISDKGYGIPKDQQNQVFSKFFRADNIVRKDSGNGLGLYLVKQIVEVSGGKIWFNSKEDKGTTFTFTLPTKGSKVRVGEVSIEEEKHE